MNICCLYVNKDIQHLDGTADYGQPVKRPTCWLATDQGFLYWPCPLDHDKRGGHTR